VRVGEQQHRLVYVRQYGREVAEVTHQRTLPGEEGAPQRPVIVVGVAPDVPVDCSSPAIGRRRR
jgi:hypothetical protein